MVVDYELRRHTGLFTLNRPDARNAVNGALALAERITVNAPVAVRESRQVVLDSQRVTDKEGWQITRDHFRVLVKTDDFKESPLAFVEKRDPVWKGR